MSNFLFRFQFVRLSLTLFVRLSFFFLLLAAILNKKKNVFGLNITATTATFMAKSCYHL